MNRMTASTEVASASPAPRGCTNFKLRQLMRRVTQHYDAEVSAAGLKTTQYSLLSHVLHLEPVRPVDLAAAMQMTPSTLSRNLQVLIEAGWLTMEPGEDARSRWVRITPEGRAKREEGQACWKRAQLGLNAQLGPARVAALHALMDESLALLQDRVTPDEA